MMFIDVTPSATPMVKDWRLLEPGSAEYFERVLDEINAVRTEYNMSRLDYLPAGRRASSYTRCALGEAFDRNFRLAERVSYNVRRNTGRSRHSKGQPTLLCDYEARFERGEFPALVR